MSRRLPSFPFRVWCAWLLLSGCANIAGLDQGDYYLQPGTGGSQGGSAEPGLNDPLERDGTAGEDGTADPAVRTRPEVTPTPMTIASPAGAAGSSGSAGSPPDAGGVQTAQPVAPPCGAEGEACCAVLPSASLPGSPCVAPLGCSLSTQTCELCAELVELPAPVPFGSLTANSVSGDGRVIVGEMQLGAQSRAFRWFWRSDQPEPFPDDSLLISTYASSVNGDGSVVVGRQELISDPTFVRGFRWAQGAPGVLPSPAEATSVKASDVSADGTVVVGSAVGSSGERALRWQDGAFVDLGDLLGSGGAAYRISADGQVIVGDSQGAANQRAFRYLWPERRVENLGVLTGNATSSARGVNADGSIVVGQSLGGVARVTCPGTGLAPPFAVAYRWTAVGMAALDSLTCGVGVQAFNLSANANVAVGFASTSAATLSNTAVLWDERGIASLASRLAELRVSAASGWTFAEANDVSDDGRVIVGVGGNPGGATRSWVAVLGKDCGRGPGN